MRKVLKWILSIPRKIIKRVKFEYDCRMADLTQSSCFDLFPPSFYMRHTPEDIDKIVSKELDDLERLVAEFNQTHAEKSICKR